VPLLLLLAVLAPLGTIPAHALPVESLDVRREWRLRGLRFEGNERLETDDLREAFTTLPRPWFALWRRHPAFDPFAFRGDLERLERLYRSRGHYHARIRHDIEVPSDGNAVVAVVTVDEGPVVLVERVGLTLRGTTLAPAEARRLRAGLPLLIGDAFSEEAYARGLAHLRAFYRERGFARVTVQRRATVDVARNVAVVDYDVESGPPASFGAIVVEGASRVGEAAVRRELAFASGRPFTQSAIDQSRDNLAALNLFRSVRIEEDESRAPRVDTRVRVVELPPREVRFGVGFDTEEQVRGLASWRHYDFLGGARQLGFTAQASFIARTLAADFLQPHFPGHANRTRLLFAQSQDEEETFTLDRTRLGPRLEWQATPRVTGFAFHRLEYDSLADVSDAVRARLPDAAPANAVLSGVGVGLDWNATDNLLDPTRGLLASATVEPVGGVLGGDVAFVRLVGEVRLYQPLVAGWLGATRLRLGAAEPVGGSREVPLFERFYAGGLNSVRGYARRRIGPLAADDPIGGRTLIEASVELRHAITRNLAAAVFADAGQVDLRSFTLPWNDLRWGAGTGLRYKSPVGPLRIDLAFPTDPPPGDDRWQVHFSLGAAF
jgi:outer membrane protein assembly complex protein YaeT